MKSGVILGERSPPFKVAKHRFYYQRTDFDKPGRVFQCFHCKMLLHRNLNDFAVQGKTLLL